MAHFSDLILASSVHLQTLSLSESSLKDTAYRFFFYNFLISASLPDILALSKSAQGESHLQIHAAVHHALTHVGTQISSYPLDEAFPDQDVTVALVRMVTSNMLTIIKDDFK